MSAPASLVTAPVVGSASSAGTAPLVVSTRCPSCGGALDFDEGSNAIRCGFCGSGLLVTGRKRVLSFAVSPRVAGGEALATARFAASAGGSAPRCEQPLLCFVPYYRFVADEYRWQEPAEPASPEERGRAASGLASRVVTLLRGGPGDAASILPATSRRRDEAGVEFLGRRIERSFLASDAPGLACASLGVRTEVLALELLHAGVVPEGAVVLAATLGEQAALERASAATVHEGVLERALVSRLLSIVHLPLWIVRVVRGGDAALVAIDAITGSVVAADAPPGALEACAAATVSGRATLGFRPLLCPNCGGDLPPEPRDVVFACGACARAWLIEGSELTPVPFAVAAAPPASAAADLEHRPIWVLDAAQPPADASAGPFRGALAGPRSAGEAAGASGRGRRLFVPAFRAPSLKLVKDLATRLSRCAPEVELEDDAPAPLRGCALDGEDAARVAAFVAAGSRLQRAPALPEPSGGGRLVWFPIVRQPYGWIEPRSGMALPPDPSP